LTPAITCSEVGCDNKIPYDKDAASVPLYCTIHRKSEGRHAMVRVLIKPETVKKVVIPKVVMICPRCKRRRDVLKEVWITGEPTTCECGIKMVYHKDKDEDEK
jgi:hypothetical protein